MVNMRQQIEHVAAAGDVVVEGGIAVSQRDAILGRQPAHLRGVLGQFLCPHWLAAPQRHHVVRRRE